MQKSDFRKLPIAEQIAALLDAGSRSDISSASPQEVILARGTIENKVVWVAAQNGEINGGTLGADHTRALVEFSQRAIGQRPAAIVLLLDSGGVRLQEGNRGMAGLATALTQILAARRAGIVTIAVIGGRVGCWGGATLLAAVCDSVLMLETARYGLSGPKVLQEMAQVNGRTLDVQALAPYVSATHRRATGEIDQVVTDDAQAVREAVATAIRQGASDPIHRAVQTLDDMRQVIGVEPLRDQAPVEALPGVVTPPAVDEMLNGLFAQHTKQTSVAGVVAGEGVLEGSRIPFFGCTLQTAMGPAQGLDILRAALAAYHSRPRCILLLADAVQAFDTQNEQYGYGRVLGALTQVLDHTVATGCPVICLLRQAGSGASMVALAMCGVSLYACNGAQIHPLPPNVVSAFIGDMPRAQIDASPDVDSFQQLNVVREVWGNDYITRLQSVLSRPDIASAG